MDVSKSEVERSKNGCGQIEKKAAKQNTKLSM